MATESIIRGAGLNWMGSLSKGQKAGEAVGWLIGFSLGRLSVILIEAWDKAEELRDWFLHEQLGIIETA